MKRHQLTGFGGRDAGLVRHRLRPDSVVHSQDHRLAAVPYKLVRGGGRVFRCQSGLLREGEVWVADCNAASSRRSLRPK
jgi:hypothetical protein